MMRFLIIGNYRNESVCQADSIDVKDLVDIKNGMSDYIIDTENGSYYNKDENKWIKIKPQKVFD